MDSWMTDISASFARVSSSAQIATQSASPEAGTTAFVSTASTVALSEYGELCRRAIFGPAQSPLWVKSWIGECSPDAIVATLTVAGRPVLSLALEIVSSGPFRIAQFVSGRHANGNFPASDPDWAAKATRRALAFLWKAISNSRPDIDLVALHRLLPETGGKPNPLLALPSFGSPNISLALDLAGGFDAVLEHSNGNSKRKRYRSQARKFDAVGPHRRIEAATPDETRALLDAFFAMKDARFKKMGITDVFADPQVRAFFNSLFANALDEPVPPFVLHGLEVGGKLRAITGSSRSDGRLICEFGSIADDDLASLSPGGFLFFENIQEACEQGFAIYDFSVGDEPYKRQWCDLEIQHADVLVPLTFKGRAFAFALQRNERLKAYIKSNPAIWNLMKLARRKVSSQDTKQTSDHD
jgi:CelD/BcsL family acetyltransferase involved in cellulose biosynthesis